MPLALPVFCPEEDRDAALARRLMEEDEAMDISQSTHAGEH